MPKFPKVLVCLLLACTLLCGCSLIPTELEDIEVNVDELTIYLPGYFKNYVTEPVDGFFMYGYDEVTVGGFREDYSFFEEIPSLEDYANKMIADNELEGQVEIIDGIVTFTFPKLVNDRESYTYLTAVFAGKRDARLGREHAVFAGTDAFWTIQAGVRTLNFDTAKQMLMDIIKTAIVR